MEWIDGVSQCWWLSKTCAIDWDAWSSIGTMLGVLTALLGPAVRRFFASRRVSAIFAAAYAPDLSDSVYRIKEFRKAYSFSDNGREGGAARIALKDDKELQTAALALASDLGRLTSAEVDLSKFPDVNTVLAADVSRSVFFAREISRLAGLIELVNDQVTVDDWNKFCDAFERNLDDGLAVIEHAAKATRNALVRMSILKSFR